MKITLLAFGVAFLACIGRAFFSMTAPRARSVPGYVSDSVLQALNTQPLESVEWGFLSGEVSGHISAENLTYELRFVDEAGRPVSGIPLTLRDAISKPKLVKGELSSFLWSRENEKYAEPFGTTDESGTLRKEFSLRIRGGGFHAKAGFGWNQFVSLFTPDRPCSGLTYDNVELPEGLAFVLPDGNVSRRVVHYFVLNRGDLSGGLYDASTQMYYPGVFDGTLTVRRPASGLSQDSRILIRP